MSLSIETRRDVLSFPQVGGFIFFFFTLERIIYVADVSVSGICVRQGSYGSYGNDFPSQRSQIELKYIKTVRCVCAYPRGGT